MLNFEEKNSDIDQSIFDVFKSEKTILSLL